MCEKHFPELNPARRDELVSAYDHIVRGHVGRLQTTPLSRVGKKDPSRSALFKRMDRAIADCDHENWIAAKKQMDELAKDRYERAITLIRSRIWPEIQHIPHMRSIEDYAIELNGPTTDSYRDNFLYWETIRRALDIAIILLPNGRPSVANKDYILRELINLWSELSGKQPRQPTSLTGASNRLGAMFSFLKEAAAVYDDVGLKDAVPERSGAAWQRLLRNQS